MTHDFLYDIQNFNEQLDRFYLICRDSKTLELVKLEHIITKCISIESENEVFFLQ
jgi:hypothetical protein